MKDKKDSGLYELSGFKEIFEIEDWKKIKIVRDFNKIHYAIKDRFINDVIKRQKIKKQYSSRYLNLLELIKNKWLYNNLGVTTKKFNISDLNNIDFEFFEEICKFDNIIIVNPKFVTYYYKKDHPNIPLYRSTQVSDIITNTIEHIKTNPHDMFYIYSIEKYYGRFYQCKDEDVVKKNRKEKLKKINEL